MSLIKMKSVTVITPSRVHIALIDLNGSLGRVDGGIGLSLANPGFRISAQCSHKSEVVGPEETVQRAGEVLELLQKKDRCGQCEDRDRRKYSRPYRTGIRHAAFAGNCSSDLQTP